MGLDRRSEREDIESVHDEANEGQHKGSAWFWVCRCNRGNGVSNLLAGVSASHLLSAAKMSRP